MLDSFLEILTDFFLNFLFDSLGFFIPKQYHRPLAVFFAVFTMIGILILIGAVIVTLSQ